MLFAAAWLAFDLYQAAGVYCALLWGMVMVHKFCCLLLLTPLAYAAPASDTVNERIPVSRAALEAHWHVDCRSSWAQLCNAGMPPKPSTAAAKCAIAAGLRDKLELCAFIYQPPGGIAENGCRDYRGAVELLDSAGSGNSCAGLAEFLGVQPACPGVRPE